MSTKAESEKYEVCFVLNREKEEDSELLQKAFDAMATHDLDPTWVSQKSCLQIDKREQKLFVMNLFEGQVYEHLKSLSCRIVGPLCILSCLQKNDSLPKRPHPVFSVTMRGIVVTCSSLDKTSREALSSKIQLMGGNFSKDLTKSVTHLVVGEVGSKKYHVAANFGLPIMLSTWIQELWENGQYNQTHGTDALYEKFKCPVFKGLSITVSQLSMEERTNLKTVIEENGGLYSGKLNTRETTHVVLLEPRGDKYTFAKSSKLHCVKVEWIYDSLRHGYCMDETLYPLDGTSQPNQSTPIKDKGNVKLTVDCSVINASVISHLDETSRNDFSVVFRNKSNSLNEIDEFDMSVLPKFGQFLDGCKVFLCGFKGQHLDKLRKIVNFGGGMRFSNYSDSISHVVCHEKNEQLIDCIKNSSVKPHVVTFRWLLECSKLQKMVDEGPFTLPDLTSPSSDPPEGLIPNKENSKMSSNAELFDTKVEAPSKNTTMLSKDLTLASDFTEILKQYATDNPADTSLAKAEDVTIAPNNRSWHDLSQKVTSSASKKQSVTSDPVDDVTAVDLTVEPQGINPIARPTDPIRPPTTVDQPAPINYTDILNNVDLITSKLFQGKTFKVIGFGAKEIELLSNMISLNGGYVSETLSDTRTDITIVPLIWDSGGNDTIVTNCWLQRCLEDNRLLSFDDNALFRPFNIATTTKQPLKNLVISISQYGGTERDCLMHLAEILGARCQEYFVRKSNPVRGHIPNTHLIICLPEGNKYKASKKWKIPAVTKHWLLEAAKTDSIPPVEHFLVELGQPEAPIHSIPEAKLNDSNCKPNGEENPQVLDVSTPSNNGETIADRNESNKCNEREIDDDVFIAPNNRVMELIDNERKFSPKLSKSNTSNISCDSEHRTPKFSISGLLADLDSSQQDKITNRKPSLPLEEALTRNINMALRTAGCLESNSPLDSPMIYVKNKGEMKSDILEDVILCVSKKLYDLRSELKRIVISLGGQFRWTFDRHCSHFVFQGKGNDFTKDFREAKQQGMKIVSPDWLYYCQETQTRVPEDRYPHTLKPRLSLIEQISTSKSSTNEVLHSPIRKNDPSKEPQNVQDAETPKCADPVNEFDTPTSSANVPDVSKELDELIVAAKSAKAGKRRCRAHTNSTSTSPVDKGKGIVGVSPAYSNIYSNHELKNVAHHLDVVCTEPSQSVPITWDDPTGRKEREKIAATNSETKNNFPDADSESTASRGTTPPNSEHSENPEGAAFSSIFINNQSVVNQAQSDKNTADVKKFMFTSFPENEKEKYASIVSQLGGLISDIKTFDHSATHLIMGHPLKNQKFLASVAAGKWVLHQSYLIDSVDSKCFLPEEAYEWGSEFTQSFTNNPSISIHKVSFCARRWRLKLADRTKLSGAFHNWKVVIVADSNEKFHSYVKILEAGGAKIFPISSIAAGDVQLTHAFVEVGQDSDHCDDLKLLVTRQVKCVKTEYLAYYLIEDPPPSEDGYVPIIVKKLLSSSGGDSVKRTLLSSGKGTRKKSRLN